jgi:hypothetical protein
MGEGWNYLMPELTPEPDSTSGESKIKNGPLKLIILNSKSFHFNEFSQYSMFPLTIYPVTLWRAG